MAATLFVDGILLWAVISYAATGRPLTATDWFISAGLIAAVLGASLVLLRLIRGHRAWLAGAAGRHHGPGAAGRDRRGVRAVWAAVCLLTRAPLGVNRPILAKLVGNDH